jgi:hypothetical protein
MPLIDVTTAKNSKVKSRDAENYDVIQAVKRKSHTATWDKIVRTIDSGIEYAMDTGNGRLVWSKSAALFGHSSPLPKRDVDHLWEHIISAVGDDKECKQAVGGLLRWRISLRGETWLVFRKDSGEIDPVTGKQITISEYWINENFNN